MSKCIIINFFYLVVVAKSGIYPNVFTGLCNNNQKKNKEKFKGSNQSWQFANTSLYQKVNETKAQTYDVSTTVI